ncbi:MAG TPA: hypothetical protein VGJ86_25915 [Acidimicrobiales bacterium]|jgi:hypothetical protein
MAGGSGLDDLGIEPGDRVRWRRRSGGHWQEGVVIRREADGSVALRDADGRWRSIVVERLEAQHIGKRGARVWEPLRARADRAAQLSLWP